MDDYCYELKNSLYLNITNRCNNSCVFCIKYRKRKFEEKYNLWLKTEPLADDILKLIDNPQKYEQIVFCGYGEPLIRLNLVKEISKSLKDKSAKIRVNTDGLANLFHGRNILPELKDLIDELYISLNAHDSKSYLRICKPIFGEKSFENIVNFARLAKDIIPSVVLTAVDLPSVDIKKCEEISKQLGLNFILRPFYDKNYKDAY